MHDIIEDYRRENFTKMDWLKYGILYPIGIIILASIF